MPERVEQYSGDGRPMERPFTERSLQWPIRRARASSACHETANGARRLRGFPDVPAICQRATNKETCSNRQLARGELRDAAVGTNSVPERPFDGIVVQQKAAHFSLSRARADTAGKRCGELRAGQLQLHATAP